MSGQDGMAAGLWVRQNEKTGRLSLTCEHLSTNSMNLL